MCSEAVLSLTDAPVGKAGSVIRVKTGDDQKSARETFVTETPATLARTVHSAKGESHPAVLLTGAKKSNDRENAREWIREL